MDQTTISETLKKIEELEAERNKALSTFREIQDKITELQKFLIYGGYYGGAGTAVFICRDLYKISYTKNVISYLETLRRHSIAPVDIYMFLRDNRTSYEPPYEKHVYGGWYRLEEADLAQLSSVECDIFNRYKEETTSLIDTNALAVEACITRDKSKVLLDIIKDISEGCSRYAPRKEVIERAEVTLNINWEKIDQIINRLRQNGNIFEPRPGFIAVVDNVSNKPMTNIDKNKAKDVLNIITRLSEDNSGYAPQEDVIECAITGCGIKLEDVSTILQWLRRNGEIFEPRSGFLKVL